MHISAFRRLKNMKAGNRNIKEAPCVGASLSMIAIGKTRRFVVSQRRLFGKVSSESETHWLAQRLPTQLTLIEARRTSTRRRDTFMNRAFTPP